MKLLRVFPLSCLGLMPLSCGEGANDTSLEPTATEGGSATESDGSDAGSGGSTAQDTSTTGTTASDSGSTGADSGMWPPTIIDAPDYDDPTIRASIYFGPSENLQAPLLAQLESATSSIDMAVYNIRLEEIGDELLAKTNAGLDVRVAMDQGQMDQDFNTLDDWMVDNGIDLTGIDAGPSGLMHNKFTVVDGQRVMTGSVNYSFTGLNVSDEDLLIIDDAQIAALYQAEFDELLAGIDPPHSPNPDAPVQVFFGPDDDPSAALVAALNGAQTSIHAKLFLATLGDVQDALLAALGRGVEVVLIMDAEQAADQDLDETVEGAGARIIRVPKTFPDEVHDKMCVIDGELVFLGSYNWTFSASVTHHENLVRIESDAIATRVETEILAALRRYDSGLSPSAYGWSEGTQDVRFELVNVEVNPDVTANIVVDGQAMMLEPMGDHLVTTLPLPAGDDVSYHYELHGPGGQMLTEPAGRRVVIPYAAGQRVVYDTFVGG